MEKRLLRFHLLSALLGPSVIGRIFNWSFLNLEFKNFNNACANPLLPFLPHNKYIGNAYFAPESVFFVIC